MWWCPPIQILTGPKKVIGTAIEAYIFLWRKKQHFDKKTMNLKAGRLELLQSFMHLSALSIMHCNGKIVNCPEHLQNYMKEFQCIRQNHNALQSSSNNRPLYCISLHFLISPMKIWVEYLQCNATRVTILWEYDSWL